MISRTTVKWQLAATTALLHILETSGIDLGNSDELIPALEKLRESTEALRREIYTERQVH